MDVLRKIKELREKRGWSEYMLSEKAGITQSTISSWYRKGTLPTIPSLEKICNAFGITMSQFFLDDGGGRTVRLKKSQKELLGEIDRLSEEQQRILLEFIRTINKE